MKKVGQFLKKYLAMIAIAFVMLYLLNINLTNNYWTSTSKKILEWDVRSYVLQPLFIYQDITLKF